MKKAHPSNDILNEGYRNNNETIYLNSIKGLSESIIEASQEPLESSTPFEELDW